MCGDYRSCWQDSCSAWTPALLRWPIGGRVDPCGRLLRCRLRVVRDAQPVVFGFVAGDFGVAAAQVLHESVPFGQGLSGPEAFPRIGRSQALSRLWSASMGLLAYCSTARYR